VDFVLNDEQQLLRETTAKFLDDTCPLAEVRRIAEEVPAGFDRDWWRQGAELGWTSMLVPEELGGGCVSGGPLADLALVAEEMGRRVTPGPLAPTNVVAAAIARSGSPVHHKQLTGLVSGETVATWWPGSATFGFAASSGRDTELRAIRGRDGYVVEGTTGPVEAGAEADQLLVVARTDEGLVQLLVASGTPGLSTAPAGSIDLVRRFAVLAFDHVEVGAEAELGGSGSAEADIERQLHDVAVLQCAEMAGAADRVFEFTIAYAEERYSFGRPLVSYQALKHRFADMKMWLEASHATSCAAARAVDSGSEHAPELISVAKAYVGDRTPAILQDCVQLHGGIGVTWEHDLHLYLRRVIQDRSLFGTPSDHRERIAAIMGE
jgi:alkylation response protein AidB-like acyl-CoA dehydrogenase